jgi:hypothetical protein
MHLNPMTQAFCHILVSDQDVLHFSANASECVTTITHPLEAAACRNVFSALHFDFCGSLDLALRACGGDGHCGHCQRAS